jgi:hypothetical protein
MVGRHKSSGSRPKLTGRPKHGSYVLRNVGLFAGYTDDSVLDQDDAFDLAEQLASHKPGDDASGPARMPFLTTAMTRPARAP